VSDQKAWLAWSSGKDAAWALHVVRTRKVAAIVGLLSTVTAPYARVSMHGVRETVLEAQAEALGLPIHRVYIPAPCSNEAYEAAMRQALASARAAGVNVIVFGDIALADVRAWREAHLARVGMSALFPLWQGDTRALAREMISAGLRAYVTCLDPRRVPRALAGRRFDDAFLAALPAEADPCGENGEFHTCVVDGPMFRHPVAVRVGVTVEREGFVFTDLELVAPVSETTGATDARGDCLPMAKGGTHGQGEDVGRGT